MSSNCNVICQCVLRSRNYRHRDVNLPDQTPIIVGRGPATKIRERRCSKSQIQIIADYKLQKAAVLQLGPNPSEINGSLLVAEEETEVLNGSSINLIENDLKYTLEFLENVAEKHNKHSKSSPSKSSKKQRMSLYSPSRNEDESTSRSIPLSASSATPSDSSVNENIVESHFNETKYEIENKLKEIQQSVVTDFHLLSTDDCWEEYDHSKIFIFTPCNVQGSEKIAAFDLDNTIICTKSGKVFPVDTHDWKILYPDIPGKLKQLYNDGYKIIIFTNQKGISRGKTSASQFQKKVQNIIQRLGTPIQAIVSTGTGKYRKPNTGMWDYFVQKCNQGIPVDRGKCFFVGDAAGRPANWAPKKKKDFSCADRLFALNINIKFFTPEEYFLNQKPASYLMPSFDPRTIKFTSLAVRSLPLPEKPLNEIDIIAHKTEVIVFVGFPAAGKSHFVEAYLKPRGYVHINRDILGSWQKCVSECNKALSSGSKVVIDNTNPDSESRARYVECAKKYGVICRCFIFSCSIEQARHNNVYRQLMQPDKKHVEVNDMVLNSYKSKYKEPSLKEGFDEIVKVNFVPKFKSKEEEELFKKYLTEK